jgi:hypothetical protein
VVDDKGMLRVVQAQQVQVSGDGGLNDIPIKAATTTTVRALSIACPGGDIHSSVCYYPLHMYLMMDLIPPMKVVDEGRMLLNGQVQIHVSSGLNNDIKAKAEVREQESSALDTLRECSARHHDRVDVKSASFTHGDQISWNHISTIPTPIAAIRTAEQLAAIRTAEHHSRRATLTTELSTSVPTSNPSRRATLPTELPSFVQQYNNNMQSTDVAQQAAPMLAHTLARASPAELSSSMLISTSSTSTPHDPSSYTENDMELCLSSILSEDFLND